MSVFGGDEDSTKTKPHAPSSQKSLNEFQKTADLCVIHVHEICLSRNDLNMHKITCVGLRYAGRGRNHANSRAIDKNTLHAGY